MKNFLYLSVAALLLAGSPVHAQKPEKQNSKAERQKRDTPEAPKSRNAVTALAEALQALTLTADQNKKLEGAAFQLEVQILGMLTPEQQAQFKEAQERLKKANKERKSEPAQEEKSMMAQLQESLKLTPGQKMLTDPLFNATQKRLTEIEATQSTESRKDVAKAFKETLDDLRTRLRPMLNPEQQKLLESWKPRMKK